MQMNYLNSLKVALLLKDLKLLEELMYSMPDFSSLDELRLASSLMQEARVLFECEKEKSSKTLKELKRTKALLNSSKDNRHQTLDLTL